MDAHASTCSHCQSPLHLEGNPYAAHLEVLNNAVGHLTRSAGSLTAERASSLYAHVTGSIQQMLDTARDHLDRNFRKLSGMVTGDDPDIMRFVEGFNEAQREITQALGDFGRLLASSRDPVELERNRGAFEQVKTRIQAAVGALSQIDAESEDPLLAAPAVTPLPLQVPQSLEAISEAMQSLDRYIADRDVAGLEACLSHLDAARGPLAALLAEIRAQEESDAQHDEGAGVAS